MNNAGVGNGGGVFGDPARWRRLIDVNLFGVVNGVQAFGAAMIAQGTTAAIVNTGSKQGITCPPATPPTMVEGGRESRHRSVSA